MRLRLNIIFVICLLHALLSCTILGAVEKPSYLVHVDGKQCKHGLNAQPNGGPFSAYVFCDDALGTNIGIILTEPAAGPGKIKLEGRKTWDKWSTTNRFWQNEIWSADITSFAWSADYRYLYISSSSIYGQGGVFKLDLRNRSYSKLSFVRFGKVNESITTQGIFRAHIIEFDADKEIMTFELVLRSSGNKAIKINNVVF